MKSENLQNNFYNLAYYFGILVFSDKSKLVDHEKYHDLEVFFLNATYYAKSPRFIEGLITWSMKFGSYLSPSKLRRLIKMKTLHNPQVLGSLLDIIDKKNNRGSFRIVTKLLHPLNIKLGLTPESKIDLVRKPYPEFYKWGIVIPHYECNEDKYLRPMNYLVKNCVEIKNRILIGSAVHADLVTMLQKNKNNLSNLNAYRSAKMIYSERSSVNKIYDDILYVI